MAHPQHDIDTAIVSLLQFDLLLRYLSNFGNLRFFLLRDLLCYHDGELIRGQILFAPIMRPHSKNLLLPETPCIIPVNSFLVLLELPALTPSSNSHIVVFPTVPTTIFYTLPFVFLLCGKGSLRRKNRFSGGHGELSVSSIEASRASRCLFVCFEKQLSKHKKQDCILIYLLLIIGNYVR